MHICTCQCLLLSNPTRSFFCHLNGTKNDCCMDWEALGAWEGTWRFGMEEIGAANGGEGESRGGHHGWHGCWGLGGFGCGSLGREGASF